PRRKKSSVSSRIAFNAMRSTCDKIELTQYAKKRYSHRRDKDNNKEGVITMPGQEQKRPHQEDQAPVEPTQEQSGGGGEDEEEEKDELEDFEIDDILKKSEGLSKHYKQKGGE
ncbi:MAG: hypothetical protein U1A23_03370, partial [Candidatus Sungbacteria bacterium]|nr:hypothetical protein [Candidatus Sungbacteria bacterium]